MGDTFPLASSEINLVPAVQGVPGGCQALMDGQTDTKWLGKESLLVVPLGSLPCSRLLQSTFPFHHHCAKLKRQLHSIIHNLT